MFNNRGQFYLSGETSALKWEWWWATLESNQACVSARELQSPATPCGLSPTGAWNSCGPQARQPQNSPLLRLRAGAGNQGGHVWGKIDEKTEMGRGKRTRQARGGG